MTVYKGEKATTVLVTLEKKPNVDYLYRTAVGKDNSISWSNRLMFCGVYDVKSRALYLTEDALHSLTDGPCAGSIPHPGWGHEPIPVQLMAQANILADADLQIACLNGGLLICQDTGFQAQEALLQLERTINTIREGAGEDEQ